MVFCLCTNKIEASELKISTLKHNKFMIAIFVLSLMLHIVLFIKIRFHKFQQQNTVYVVSFRDYIKQIGISSIDKQALSDISTTACSIFLFVFVTSIPSITNEMNPVNANKFPYYLFVYFNHFIVNTLVTLLTASIYYLRHPELRNAVNREIKSRYQSISNSLKVRINV